MNDIAVELLKRTQQLLDAIAAQDWKTYESLCDPALTCFEPEARGQLVEGMGFHKFYFDLEPAASPRGTTIASPNVRVIGDAAVVSYVRLTQALDEDGHPVTSVSEETRIWQRRGDVWRLVHFHRSLVG